MYHLIHENYLKNSCHKSLKHSPVSKLEYIFSKIRSYFYEGILNDVQFSDNFPDSKFHIYNAPLTATDNTDQSTNKASLAIPVPRSNETVSVLESIVIPSSSIA